MTAERSAGFVVAVDDPRADDVVALIETHLDFAHAATPICHVNALAVDALAAPDVTVFSVRCDGEVLAIGALRRLDAEHAEIKSMHTLATARRSGAGAALLSHLIAAAQAEGYRRLSLETGTTEEFAPARALYVRAGFAPCPPFGEYTDNPHSVCMTMELDP